MYAFFHLLCCRFELPYFVYKYGVEGSSIYRNASCPFQFCSAALLVFLLLFITVHIVSVCVAWFQSFVLHFFSDV